MATELSDADLHGLKFISQYPTSARVKEIMLNLSHKAQRVALGIMGDFRVASDDEIMLAKEFVDKAENVRQNQKQTKQQRINQLNRVIQEAQSELRQLEGKK